MSGPSSRQKQLSIALYRSLAKWCRQAPPTASLSHLQGSLPNSFSSRDSNYIDISTPALLRQSLRQAFREASKSESDTKQRIQDALDGLRTLAQLDPMSLPIATFNETTNSASTNDPEQSSSVASSSSSLGTLSASSTPHDWTDMIQWLPSLSEMEDQPYRPSDIPMFPLFGPVIPAATTSSTGKHNLHLPLFSALSDIPVAGMEIPLRIFEPRYRELYKDILSNGTKRFMVPLAHPHDDGRYATHAWLYEIMRVEDIADQTNGQVHLLAHHLVTRVVRIDSIVNPSDAITKATYLRVQGEVLKDNFANSEDFLPLEEEIRQLMASENTQHAALGNNLMSALAEGNIWSMVSVYMTWIQMQVFEVQSKISAKIKLQAQQAETKTIDDSMIELAQAPHARELESLLLEVATLVPLLLQESPRDQCARMLQRLQCRFGSDS